MHVAHQEGIVQIVERSLEKPPGAGGLGMPAMNQHPRDGPAHPERGGQLSGLRFLDTGEQPAGAW